MTYFAIGKKENVTYGHGSYGEEIHITHICAYLGDMRFHPLFENKEDAKKYIKGLKNNDGLFPVELNVFTPLTTTHHLVPSVPSVPLQKIKLTRQDISDGKGLGVNPQLIEFIE